MHFDKFFDSHKFFAHPYSQDEHSQSLSSGFPTTRFTFPNYNKPDSSAALLSGFCRAQGSADRLN